jgi:hypothetical protein
VTTNRQLQRLRKPKPKRAQTLPSCKGLGSCYDRVSNQPDGTAPGRSAGRFPPTKERTRRKNTESSVCSLQCPSPSRKNRVSPTTWCPTARASCHPATRTYRIRAVSKNHCDCAIKLALLYDLCGSTCAQQFQTRRGVKREVEDCE